MRGGRLTAAASALALGVTGIAATGTAVASVARGDVTGATVQVFIERDHTVHIDQELRPGVHRFVIRSERTSGFQLIRPDAGYTKREALRDVALGLEEGRIKALVRFENNVTLAGGITTKEEMPGVMWADLDPGTYWALDTYDRAITPAEALTVRVEGAPLRSEVRRGAVLRAVGSAEWAAKPTSMPAQGRLTFRNDSEENHFLGMAKLKPGNTLADFAEALESGPGGPSPVRWSVGIETGVVSPGEEMTMTYDLPRGRYVMVCWWPDASMGGMPHALMGMYRVIKVG